MLLRRSGRAISVLFPDQVDISSGTSKDCDSNSIPDECDLQAGTAQDCNSNGIPDSCDIASGAATDEDGNQVPDSCEEPRFRRGDSNVDRELDISDSINTLGYLFTGAGKVLCPDAADANDDGVLDISDGVFTLRFSFLGGNAPPEPGPDACGTDPKEDLLPDCSYDPARC